MLKDKVVFIIGLVSGIGYEIVKKFVSEGVKVVIFDMNVEKCVEMVVVF